MEENKMLQILIDGQAEIKNQLKSLGSQLSQVELKLSSRIDSLGKQLNELDEDAPTNEEHKELEKRVSTLEQQVAKS